MKRKQKLGANKNNNNSKAHISATKLILICVATIFVNEQFAYNQRKSKNISTNQNVRKNDIFGGRLPKIHAHTPNYY